MAAALSLCLAMAGCQKPATTSANDGLCHIHGTMESNQWDGKRIFLVPMFGPKDSAHVDSLVVQDGKFEFVADTTEMKIIRMDYHYRMGLQELLVISEPGDVNVTIGGVSTGGGTPQNDSLQVWKDKLNEIHEAYENLKRQAKAEGSDAVLLTEGKVIQRQHDEFNTAFARRQPDGVLKSFLNKLYPYTIQRADDNQADR